MTRDNAHQAFHPLSSSMQTLPERAETSVPAQEAQTEKQKSPYGIWDDEPTERLMPHDDFAEGSASSASVGKSSRRLYSDSYEQTVYEQHESASEQLLRRARQRVTHSTEPDDLAESYYEGTQQQISAVKPAHNPANEQRGERTTHVIAQRENMPEELIQDDWDEWETPAKTRAFRWKVPPYAVFVLALGVLGIILWGLLGFTPTPQANEESTSSAQVAAPGASSSVIPSAAPSDSSAQNKVANKNGTIRVHIAGAVKTPGVQTLPADARAIDALEAAGGATPDADLNRVNLAGSLSDGTQLYIPKTGETAAPVLAAPAGGNSASPNGSPGAAQNPAAPKSSAGTGQQSAPGSPINLNTATAEQLQTLPRIGPSLAARIISWRDAHGGFKSVDELDAVPGIGPSLMSSLRPLVTV